MPIMRNDYGATLQKKTISRPTGIAHRRVAQGLQTSRV
ncbi:Unknown protein sequence [Pseudomonas coronafaciens pv. oryzae]|nr:Unknown protein sequence [Pseudomonas coronafaciens pv. oryzae]